MRPNQYNKFVSAKISYPTRYLILHEKVVKHVMHDPRGALMKNNPCIWDGKWKNQYPYHFCTKIM